MADTRVQHEVEDWVRESWMPGRFGSTFRRLSVPLVTGGKHSFAAVSDDHRVVAKIMTGNATTSGGKLAVGKLMKLRADMLFLLMVDADRRVVIVTEPDMYRLCERERGLGRVPQEIEFLPVTIPVELLSKLESARRAASREMSA